MDAEISYISLEFEEVHLIYFLTKIDNHSLSDNVQLLSIFASFENFQHNL